MDINLHHLKLFHYVAEARGISAAAKVIPYGIQQPAISQQLIQLEENLGVKLFIRRPFALTPAGERLYRFTSKTFNELDTLLENLKDEAGVRVRIAVPAVISAHFLPRIIADVLDVFPFLRPSIVEIEGNAAFSALFNGEIDIALTMADLPRSKQIVSSKIISLPLALIVPEQHHFALKGLWPKTDFSNIQWIAVQEATGGVDDLKTGLLNFGITPEFVASTNSIDAALNYVSMGIGLALMAQPPDSMLKTRGLKAIPMPNEFGGIDINVVRHKNSDIDRRIIEKFIEFTKKAGRSISVN